MTRREWMNRTAMLGAASLAGCRRQSPDKVGYMPEGHIHPSPEDYATARKGFRTKLTRTGPAPDEADMPSPLGTSSPEPLTYPSGGLQLRSWVNPEVKSPGPRRPVVLMLHSGFAFSLNQWEFVRQFLRAGFHAVIPVLRGENGQPGAYSLLYDEVDDCIACAELISRMPSVDPSKIFLFGHGIGGTLSLLCALASGQFRACAAISPWVSAKAFLHGREHLAPFDPTAEGELRMRSPLYFGPHFFCPVRCFFGTSEGPEGEAKLKTAQEMGKHSRGSRKDVGELTVEGDFDTARPPATTLTLGFFRDIAGIK